MTQDQVPPGADRGSSVDSKFSKVVTDAVEGSPRKSRSGQEVVADINGVVGLALLTGPNIVAGLLGLPESSTPHLMMFGGVLIVRYLLMCSLIRSGR